MFNNHTELFLTEYFFYRRVLGGLVKEPRALFDVLGEVFLLDGAKADDLYSLAESPSVNDIKTYADYLRFCRVKKYVALSGAEPFERDADDVISVKGEALKRADALKLGDEYATESAILRNLADSTERGAVASLRVLGFIECSGMFDVNDKAAGAKNLLRSAQWNSVEGILTALYFCPDSRADNINRLRTVAYGTLYYELPALAEAKYGCAFGGAVEESKLLQKAFADGKLKPETYAAQYARIIFSSILSARDKERALFSAGDQVVSDIAELPLKLVDARCELNGAALMSTPLARDKERERIQKSLYNSDLLRRSAFRPLCIVSDSEYLRKLYALAIRNAFVGAHVEYIDVAGLDEYDLQPTGKSVFVRSCDEDAFNVYFLSFTGEIREGILQEAIEFLQSRKRKKFNLVSPGVVIDLAGVLPVCFCDKANAKELKKHCDTVVLASVTDKEKPALIDDIVKAKQRLYGVKNVTIADDALTRLTALTIDGAENAIDAVLRFNRSNAETVITPALIDECAERGHKNKYGFGGDGDEI